MKRLSLFLIVLPLLVFSCRDSDPVETDSPVRMVELVTEAGRYRYLPGDEVMDFTATLTVRLNPLESAGSLLLSELPGEGAPWGDFRVRSRSGLPSGGVVWQLQPRKTGGAVLPSLSVPVRIGAGTAALNLPETSYEIRSSLLDDSGEPRPIRPLPESGTNHILLFAAAGLLLAGAAAGIVFLILRKRRRKAGEEPDPGSRILGELAVLEVPEDRQEEKELYRTLYRLVSSYLSLTVPGTGAGDTAAELRSRMEVPSSLNQWALRSLYPFLERAEQILYNPEAPPAGRDRAAGDIRLCRECLEFLKQEEKE